MNDGTAAAIAVSAGFAVMSLELAAVRLLAPFFGDSAYVWTNVIGVLLVALAGGAWLGGVLGDRERPRERLARLFVVAALLAALIPWVAGPLGAWLLPSDLALDAAMPALVRGSLAASLLLFAPPVLLAGMATPVLIAVLSRGADGPGRASGVVTASGTLGSLAGTFATTHLLIPGLGSAATIWLCAGLLLLCSVLTGGARGAAALAALPILVSLLVPDDGPRREPLPGEQLLAEVESPYQYLQVVRRDKGADGTPAARLLKINEGLDSFHSVRLEGEVLTGGRYYDFFATVPALAGASVGAPPALLSLGSAAGTFERILRAAWPGCRVDSVEIDAAVVALGREHFAAYAEDADGEVYQGLDARLFVEHATGRYDAVIVDAYERQIYIPAHVASREFFRCVRERLRPGGVVAVNVGGRTVADPVVEAMANTMAAVFGSSQAFQVPRSRNFMVVARHEGELQPRTLGVPSGLSADLQGVFAAVRDGAWFPFAFDAERPVLLDDRPFLDRLQDAALRSEGEDPSLWAMAGDRTADEVAGEAFQLRTQGRLAELRECLRGAAEPTAYLRMLAGDARWLLRDLDGAALEYDAALALNPGDDLRGRLQEMRAILEEDRDAAIRAASVAGRNGWVAGGAALVFALAAFRLRRQMAAPQPAA